MKSDQTAPCIEYGQQRRDITEADKNIGVLFNSLIIEQCKYTHSAEPAPGTDDGLDLLVGK